MFFAALFFTQWWDFTLPSLGRAQYQAIFLTNGQTYFGRYYDRIGAYAKIEDVYYLQQTEGAIRSGRPTRSSCGAAGSCTLPRPRMLVPKSAILFVEDLSRVLADRAVHDRGPAVSAYDPDRDPVRRLGRALRWTTAWLLVPLVLGVFVSGNIDVHSLPLVGAERVTAVLFQDGQAYFGHLDDSGESGTLVLRDVYYFRDAQGGRTGLPVGLVVRGQEAHEPADGMRINRDRVLALERVRPESAVAKAIDAERALRGMSPAAPQPQPAGRAVAVRSHAAARSDRAGDRARVRARGRTASEAQDRSRPARCPRPRRRRSARRRSPISARCARTRS